MIKLKRYLIIAAALAALCLLAFFGIRGMIDESGVSAADEERTEMTPLVIDSIRSIGQWELASIEATTTVDTVKKKWMGLVKEKLTRSYQGRLSVGIDMKALSGEWHRTDADTIFLYFPDICLLDSNFIDESMTKTIVSEDDDFEQNAAVKKEMLEKARRRMMKEAVTSLVKADCQQRAVKEMTDRFTAIGYKNVVVEFQK